MRARQREYIFTRQISSAKSLISLSMLAISEDRWLGKSIKFLFNNRDFFSGYALMLQVLSCCR